MRLPTGSAIGRAMACLGSCAEDGVDVTTEDGARGTVIHAFVDMARNPAIGRERALGRIEDPATAELCAAVDLDAIPAGAESEVAVAWDPDTDVVERLVLTGHRAYPDDGRMYMTLDLVGMLGPGVVVYDDLKSGYPIAARRSWQLRAGAYFLCRLTGASSARVGHLRLGQTGKVFHDRLELDAFEIDEIGDQLRALVQRVRSATGAPKLSVGAHCDHCSAIRRCPAMTGLVLAAGASLERMATFGGDEDEMQGAALEQLRAMPLEQAGVAYDRIDLAIKWLEAAKEAGKALARSLPDGLPLPGERVLAERKWSAKRKSDVAKAELAALTEDLVERREIVSVATTQVRIVSAKPKKGRALPASPMAPLDVPPHDAATERGVIAAVQQAMPEGEEIT